MKYLFLFFISFIVAPLKADDQKILEKQHLFEDKENNGLFCGHAIRYCVPCICCCLQMLICYNDVCNKKPSSQNE